nr:MAG TPA: hypothetical protein [Caudoviricetes sp.]
MPNKLKRLKMANTADHRRTWTDRAHERTQCAHLHGTQIKHNCT